MMEIRSFWGVIFIGLAGWLGQNKINFQMQGVKKMV